VSWIRHEVFVNTLYIIAFSLMIYGLMKLTSPKTAVRGNWIAAVGMTVAFVATLLKDEMGHNWRSSSSPW